jgi:putative nucleotidyltransferase with HDIG domain
MLTCPAAEGTAPTRAVLPDGVRARVEQRIADGRLDLPMLPHVASRILAGGLDESTAIGELSALLHRDQALAGHVLRVANSAAYAGGARIQSIQQGLIRIGLAQLREIVVAVALQSRVFRVDGYEDIVGGLWTHSAVAGAYAKEIARHLRVNVESAFVCGLLHDVGKPVVLTLMLDLGTDAGEAPSRQLCLQALAAYHTRVGSQLAEHWSLPDAARESIAFHHDFERAERHVQAVRITCLANILSHLALAGDDARAHDEAAVRSHPVCAALNLYPDDVEGLVARRAAMLEQAEAFSP